MNDFYTPEIEKGSIFNLIISIETPITQAHLPCSISLTRILSHTPYNPLYLFSAIDENPSHLIRLSTTPLKHAQFYSPGL